MSDVIKQEEKQIKQPINPNKKTLITRLVTIIGSCVGIVAFVLFGVFVLQETATVSFYGKGVSIAPITINKDTFQIEAPNNPTRNGYDFAGWFDNKELSGEPVNLATKLFCKEKKEFGFFGKVKQLPEAADLFAKWEIHKYTVLVYDYETGEQLVDENNNPIICYVTVKLDDDKIREAYIDEYLGIYSTESSTPQELESLKTKAEALSKADKVEISDIRDIHLALALYEGEVDFVDENGDLLDAIKRDELKITLDEEGNELPVLKVYLQGTKK